MSSRDISEQLTKKIIKLRNGIVADIVNKTQKNAQSGFNKFEVNASTDYPQVSVIATPINQGAFVTSGEVLCIGAQVLFIEFGVGKNNSIQKQAGISDWRAWTGTESAIGFIEQGAEEVAPRPAGISNLGEYGKKQGREDYWIRPSALGIPNEYAGESYVHKKNGQVRTDVVWTIGHNPARALYTAYMSAKRMVISNVARKVKLKTPKYEQMSLF